MSPQEHHTNKSDRGLCCGMGSHQEQRCTCTQIKQTPKLLKIFKLIQKKRGPPSPLAPCYWHSPAHPTHSWLWPALIDISNYKISVLTCSAYRVCEMEECAGADMTIKFMEDVGVHQP